MGKEFELKYRADKQSLAAIRERFGGFASISMETAYFDTPAGDLAKRGWMLRLRLENGHPVCTMKTPPVDGDRGEWEAECSRITDAIPILCSRGAPAELAELTAGGVQETCAARFTRLAATRILDGCTVEIALDTGLFLGGGKKRLFSELEVELKAGSKEAAAAFAQSLAREFGLTPEPKSKAQRARELANP